MLNLNASQANLRALSKDRQRCQEKRDNEWNHFQSLLKTNRPRIEALFVKEKLLFNQANENFSFAKIAFSNKEHKAAKKFSCSAKEYMHLLAKTVVERRKLASDIKDAKEGYRVATEQYCCVNTEFKQINKSCNEKRTQAFVIANIPKKYINNTSIVEYENGAINIYFGGKGSPAGKGHGHICIDPSGKVRYIRNPWDKHGSHNYVRQDKRPEKNNS